MGVVILGESVELVSLRDGVCVGSPGDMSHMCTVAVY